VTGTRMLAPGLANEEAIEISVDHAGPRNTNSVTSRDNLDFNINNLSLVNCDRMNRLRHYGVVLDAAS